MSMTNRGGGSRPSRYSSSRIAPPRIAAVIALAGQGFARPFGSGEASSARAQPPRGGHQCPPGYLMVLPPAPADLYTALQDSTVYDVVQLFVSNTDELRALGPSAIRAVKPDGLLWIAYPKGGPTVGATDLPATPWWTKRDVLGEITGETGYKPVAFVKIDDTWTALRFKKT